MISLIDYGTGNLFSLKNALSFLGKKVKIIDDPKKVENSSKIILPGVGNFGFAMQNLRSKGLDKKITKVIDSEKEVLGICLGLQILFEKSEESKTTGLGVLEGDVVKFRTGKVPQIGWNKIEPKKKSLLEKGYAYFANSYYARPKNNSIITAESCYFTPFPSAIKYKNLTAVQFHPEKSGEFGLNFLRRWCK